MADTPILSRPRTALFCFCLIAAPLAEVIEQALSPLTGGSTADDFAAIAGEPSRFTVSVVIGIIGTCLLLPALLGLSHRTSERTPRLALVTSIVIGLSILGFAGVRMSQAFELQLATGGLPRGQAVHQFEAAVTSPIGLAFTLAFLAGTIVGIILLAIGLLLSRRVAVAPVILLLVFPVIDTLIPGHVGPIVSHLVLLAAMCWMAVGFLRTAPARRDRATRPAATDQRRVSTERTPSTGQPTDDAARR